MVLRWTGAGRSGGRQGPAAVWGVLLPAIWDLGHKTPKQSPNEFPVTLHDHPSMITLDGWVADGRRSFGWATGAGSSLGGSKDLHYSLQFGTWAIKPQMNSSMGPVTLHDHPSMITLDGWVADGRRSLLGAPGIATHDSINMLAQDLHECSFVLQVVRACSSCNLGAPGIATRG